jgi:hypothetical protein
MSQIHPHWQSTDDAPVPVRIAAPKTAPTSIPVGATTVSRRPAAIVGILLTLSVGAVAYGTLDDGSAPLSGEVTESESSTSYFDILAEQMVRSSVQENVNTPTEEPEEDSMVYRRDLEPSIPVNPSTYDTAPVAPSVPVPTNQNTIGATVVTETFHSGAPRQPETGAGMLWVTILGALMGLAWKWKEMLKT